ncbi:MAG: hypothetical protein E7440_00815 [Ruminococcaceae bacterium]|nr:hypothetical protein [Oscillospiraceae bacterium]
MYVFFGSVLALACMAGLCCVVCLLYSKMLRPHSARGTMAVVWGVGAGEELEQRVRSLVWLQECGLLRCTVMIADVGLNEEGRALAARLAGRYPVLTLCTREELEQRMDKG